MLRSGKIYNIELMDKKELDKITEDLSKEITRIYLHPIYKKNYEKCKEMKKEIEKYNELLKEEGKIGEILSIIENCKEKIEYLKLEIEKYDKEYELVRRCGICAKEFMRNDIISFCKHDNKKSHLFHYKCLKECYKYMIMDYKCPYCMCELPKRSELRRIKYII